LILQYDALFKSNVTARGVNVGEFISLLQRVSASSSPAALYPSLAGVLRTASSCDDEIDACSGGTTVNFSNSDAGVAVGAVLGVVLLISLALQILIDLLTGTGRLLLCIFCCRCGKRKVANEVLLTVRYGSSARGMQMQSMHRSVAGTGKRSRARSPLSDPLEGEAAAGGESVPGEVEVGFNEAGGAGEYSDSDFKEVAAIVAESKAVQEREMEVLQAQHKQKREVLEQQLEAQKEELLAHHWRELTSLLLCAVPRRQRDY